MQISEILESSRLEFSKDTEDTEFSEPLNREGLADLPFLRTLQ